MNFKTTIVLLITLLAVGSFLLFTCDRVKPDQVDIEPVKLIDLKKDDVTRLSIMSVDGKQIVIEKGIGKTDPTLANAATWRLTQPLSTGADPNEVNQLLDAILELKSRAEVASSGSKAPKTGLDNPRYKIELKTNAKTVTLLVGDKLPATGGMYVRLEGQDKTQVVPSDLDDKLERPVSALRENKLVSAKPAEIQQVQITRKDGSGITLHRKGNDWEMVAPMKMPIEPSESSSLLFGITGLRAVEWVDDVSEAASLDKPTTIIAYSTQPPSTQPASAPATAPATAWNTITFGGYDDLLKKNVYARCSNSPHVAKVSAQMLEGFNKKPLELRDKKLLDIDPAVVSQISLATHLLATTQPAPRAASDSEIAIERKKIALDTPTSSPPPGVAAPSTQTATTAQSATTLPSTTQAATPPLPPSKWELRAGGSGDADEFRVTKLLDALHPMKATKYLDPQLPATQPTANYVVTIHTQEAGGAGAATYEIKLTDPGAPKPLEGTYNGLRFEVDRDVLTRVEGDWTNKIHPPEPPPMPRGGPPGGFQLPPGFQGGQGE